MIKPSYFLSLRWSLLLNRFVWCVWAKYILCIALSIKSYSRIGVKKRAKLDEIKPKTPPRLPTASSAV